MSTRSLGEMGNDANTNTISEMNNDATTETLSEMNNNAATETTDDMNSDAAAKKGLLDLPNELLKDILGACSTRALLSLASSNRRLRAVWFEHSTPIIKAAFGHAECFEEAVDLSLTERRMEMSIQPGDLDHDTELRLGLQRVLENVNLATFTGVAYDMELRGEDIGLEWHDVRMFWRAPYFENLKRMFPGYPTPILDAPLTSLPAAYYQVRWTMLAYRYPELRLRVLSRLLGLSLAELHTIEEISYAVQHLYLDDPSWGRVCLGPHWYMRSEVHMHKGDIECCEYASQALIAVRFEKQSGGCKASNDYWWPEQDEVTDDEEVTDEEKVDMEMSDQKDET